MNRVFRHQSLGGWGLLSDFVVLAGKFYASLANIHNELASPVNIMGLSCPASDSYGQAILIKLPLDLLNVWLVISQAVEGCSHYLIDPSRRVTGLTLGINDWWLWVDQALCFMLSHCTRADVALVGPPAGELVAIHLS